MDATAAIGTSFILLALILDCQARQLLRRAGSSHASKMKIPTFNMDNINKRLANLLIWLCKPDQTSLVHRAQKPAWGNAALTHNRSSINSPAG